MKGLVGGKNNNNIVINKLFLVQSAAAGLQGLGRPAGLIQIQRCLKCAFQLLHALHI